MISIKNLVKIYNKGKGNEYKALKGIDFQVQDGESRKAGERDEKSDHMCFCGINGNLLSWNRLRDQRAECKRDGVKGKSRNSGGDNGGTGNEKGRKRDRRRDR